MGQRLVIAFTDGDTTFATLYQHWSGYTESALETLQEISNVGRAKGLFSPALNLVEKKKLLVNVLASQYFAQPDEIAQSKLWDMYLTEHEISENSNRKTYTAHRNTGLVSLSTPNIEDAIYWSEMLIEIDITDFNFDLEDLFWQSSLNEIDDPFGLSPQDILKQANTLETDIVNLADIDKLQTLSSYLEMSDYCHFANDTEQILTSIV